jgi:hypothetical protein
MTFYRYDRPVPPRRDPAEIADYPEWAQFTRALMGWTDITAADGDTRLRQLARQQAAEAREHPPQPAAAGLPAAGLPAGVRIPVPRQAPCPGEFGPGGEWREHCPATTTTEGT